MDDYNAHRMIAHIKTRNGSPTVNKRPRRMDTINLLYDEESCRKLRLNAKEKKLVNFLQNAPPAVNKRKREINQTGIPINDIFMERISPNLQNEEWICNAPECNYTAKKDKLQSIIIHMGRM